MESDLNVSFLETALPIKVRKTFIFIIYFEEIRRNSDKFCKFKVVEFLNERNTRIKIIRTLAKITM